MFLQALSDGVTINAPTVGLATGWAVALAYVISHLRGHLHSRASWEAREADHQREMTRMSADHARELERVDHDRQQWRTESRIKDAQLAEKDTQLAERSKQIDALSQIGGTVEQAMIAVREIAARSQS
jgi:hypothetical protein